MAYDAAHNVIWAGWGNDAHSGDIVDIGLDANHNVTTPATVFNTCPAQCGTDIDDGLAYDASASNLLVSQDTSQTISTFSLNGGLVSSINWAGGSGGCYNSGVALGDQLIFEGADGCSHVYVVDKKDPATVLYDFPTAIPGDPNFRDEGLTCDTDTFAAQGEQVMWSKEAYSPMRAHAFVIPSGSCGVGGNPAPGGGPVGFSGPLPLLIAHGITGSAQGEQKIEDYARATVPGLNAANMTVKADTGATSSVFDNGSKLADEAFQMTLNTGAPSVNIIAHSKGGLDAREAIWEDPSVINQLGMLSTPNAGSAAANKLCSIRRIPFVGSHVQSQFGSCDSDNDGLYDLQTWWVKDVFNYLTRDDSTKNYYDLGSNCSTGHTTYKCNFADNALLNCRDGGDTAVCLESAYWLTTSWPDVAGGLQVAVPPLSGYDHSAMNTDPCPITDMLAQLYPTDSQGNPWIDGDGSGCENLATNGPGPNAVTSSAATASPDTTGAMADQQVISGAADPTQPFTTVLDPEGGDTMTATVFIPVGVTPTITVTDTAGNSDANASVKLTTDSSGTGAQIATVSLSELSGAKRVLHVATDGSSAVGVATQVSSGAALTASAKPAAAGSSGNATVTATVGLSAAQAKTLSVSAAYTDGSGQRVTTPLTYSGSTGSSSTFSATITVPTGSAVAIDLTARGTGFARYANTGVFLPNGDGQLGTVHGDALVDTDHDGHVDSLQIPVQITTTHPGTYHLTVDLASGSSVVASGGGDANVTTAGTSDITASVPLARLLATRAPSGTFEVVNGALTEGTSGRTLIAQRADLGATASYDLDSYTPATPTLSRLASTSLDTDNDGFLDDLRVSGAVSVNTGGDYQIAGTLYAPNGSALKQINQTATLASGRNPIRVDLDGNLIGSTGDGVYQLRGLTVTSLKDPTQRASAGTLMIGPLDSSAWIGTTPNAPTLSRLWDQAQQDGAISRYGLFVSEHNRLNRIVAAAANGDTNTEASELDTFISHVSSAGTDIESAHRNRILSYAEALRARL